jgi:NADPH:quinone reductase-like Zn-dependent oxidoreductase
MGTQVTPALRADEVLVRVAAASLNPSDCKIRGGLFPFMSASDLPMVLGSDFARTVEEFGPGSTTSIDLAIRSSASSGEA